MAEALRSVLAEINSMTNDPPIEEEANPESVYKDDLGKSGNDSVSPKVEAIKGGEGSMPNNAPVV